MEQLIISYNSQWTGYRGNGMYSDWMTQTSWVRFSDIETISCDLDIKFTYERWKGRIRASAGIGAVCPKDKLKNSMLQWEVTKSKKGLSLYPTGLFVWFVQRKKVVNLTEL